MHHQIDSLAYTNRLRALPPIAKLGWAIALMALSFLAQPYVQMMITAWLALWTVGYARIPARTYGQLCVLPLGFYLANLPALVLQISWQSAVIPADAWAGVAVGSGYLYLSQQGLAQAGALLARAIALTACLYFAILTVPFAELLGVLQRLGLPALVLDLLALMYRFIFILAETTTELVAAQQARSGFSSWRRQLRSVALLVGQLFERSLANYRQFSLGLTARGYDGKLHFLPSHRYHLPARYAVEAALGYAVLAGIVIGGYVAGI